MVGLLVSAPAWGFSDSSGAPAAQVAPPSEVIGPFTWTPDLQVTGNAGNDTAPIVVPLAGGGVSVLWQSDRAGPYAYYRAEFDDLGQQTTNDTYLTNKTVAWSRNRATYGPAIALDSNGDAHVVFEYDYQNVGYTKVAANGTLLQAPKKVGPVDSSSSEHPAATVGWDDTVQIVSGDYKFQCEDIVSHRLSNDGSEVWTNRVISSDVAAVTHNALIKTGPSTGNFMFTFGATTGTWLGRMDRYGLRDMPSVKIRQSSDFALVDVTETSDGSMHVVWSEGDAIYYSKVNSTGAVLANSLQLTDNASYMPGPPRIAALPGGSAVIVWDDGRSGPRQVYFAFVNASFAVVNNTWADPPRNVELTSSSGGATLPWVAAGPSGAVDVAWVDARNGNPDVYYKTTFPCGVSLSVDPTALLNATFVAPGENRTLAIALKNRGYLDGAFTIAQTVGPPDAAANWSAGVSPNYLASLAGGETADVTLTVRPPPNAENVEYLTVDLNATLVGAPECTDGIHLEFYVRANRHLYFPPGGRSKAAQNGERVLFPLQIENTGDLPEYGVTIRAGAPAAPAGWNVTTDLATVDLDPHEASAFNVTVEVPTDIGLASGNMVGYIGVTATSAANPFVMAGAQLTVLVAATMSLEIFASPGNQTARNGELAQFEIHLKNVGNLAGQQQINVEASQPDVSGWIASLDRETVFLSGGESTTTLLNVRVPQGAMVNDSLSTTVSAFALKRGESNSTTVSTRVAPTCGVQTEVLEGLASSGAPHSMRLLVTNLGNSGERFSVEFSEAPGGWGVNMLVDHTVASALWMDAHASREVAFEAQPATEALAGDYVITARVSGSACGSSEVPWIVTVDPVGALRLEVNEATATVAPGSNATYLLHISNEGNCPRSVLLAVAGLWSNATYSWHMAVPTGDYLPAAFEGLASLAPFSEAWFVLVVYIPRNETNATLRFSAGISADGEFDPVDLFVTLKRPDLAVEHLFWEPSALVAGQDARITVTLHNNGTLASAPTTLQFAADWLLMGAHEVPAIEPGERTNLIFGWNGTAGKHLWRFSFLLSESAIDIDSTNNEQSVEVEVGPAPPLQGGFDAGAVRILALVAVLAGGAAIAAVTIRRRRADPRAPDIEHRIRK